MLAKAKPSHLEAMCLLETDASTDRKHPLPRTVLDNRIAKFARNGERSLVSVSCD
jgi:hypothetical protein